MASHLSVASPLSIEPGVGIATNYDSDPDLRAIEPKPETHVAFTLDAPVRYELDAASFSVTPRFRISDARGYSSLASNYFRVDASARFSSDVGAVTATGQIARDSSLYHGGESIFGVGVRRDTRSAGMNWQRSLGYRTQAQFDVNWTRVTYDNNAVGTSLVDYRYVSAAPSVSHAVTERDTVSLLGSAGRYNALSGLTRSRDYNLQIGWQRALTELWTLSATAGYSKSQNSLEYYFGPFYLGTLTSQQKGKIFSASLRRQSERMSLIANVSESYRPTGFAFLSRQDVAEVQVNYTLSERWSFQSRTSAYRTREPGFNGGEATRRYYSVEASTDWHWSPEWTVTLRASRVGLRYDNALSNANSSGVSVQLTRQFYRMDLQ